MTDDDIRAVADETRASIAGLPTVLGRSLMADSRRDCPLSPSGRLLALCDAALRARAVAAALVEAGE